MTRKSTLRTVNVGFGAIGNRFAEVEDEIAVVAANATVNIEVEDSTIDDDLEDEDDDDFGEEEDDASDTLDEAYVLLEGCAEMLTALADDGLEDEDEYTALEAAIEVLSAAITAYEEDDSDDNLSALADAVSAVVAATDAAAALFEESESEVGDDESDDTEDDDESDDTEED